MASEKIDPRIETANLLVQQIAINVQAINQLTHSMILVVKELASPEIEKTPEGPE